MQTDIAIVGAGMVGATAALALAQSGLSITLIDARQAEDWTDESWDLRVSAVNHASEQIFRSLGVWNSIEACRVSPFHHMIVWSALAPSFSNNDTDVHGQIEFDAAALGLSHLGHIVENSAIVASLHQCLRQTENIMLLLPATIDTLELKDASANIKLNNGEMIQARLLVGADGGRSRVREVMDDSVGSRYGQSAIVARIKTQHAHQSTAWQRFLETGPIALLPLADGSCSIVWSADDIRARELQSLTDDDFASTLAAAIDNRLGQVQMMSERCEFPLTRFHASRYIADHCVLIGDAAHVVHPLAGLGANLGLLDAAALSETITNAHIAGRDIGSHAVLRRYERWRHGDNALSLGTMDGFKSLFGNSIPRVRQLGAAGLNIADKIPLLKSQLMKHAMGLSGDLPGLAKS